MSQQVRRLLNKAFGFCHVGGRVWARDELSRLVEIQVVQSDGSIAPTGGVRRNVVTVTAGLTLGSAHDVILANAASGDISITLPASHSRGKHYTIKRIDDSGNSVTIVTADSDTVDGISTQSLSGREAVTALSDGANWHLY